MKAGQNSSVRKKEIKKEKKNIMLMNRKTPIKQGMSGILEIKQMQETQERKTEKDKGRERDREIERERGREGEKLMDVITASCIQVCPRVSWPRPLYVRHG